MLKKLGNDIKIINTKDDRCVIGIPIIAIFVFLIVVFHFAAISTLNETGIYNGLNYNLVIYTASFCGAMLVGGLSLFASSTVTYDRKIEKILYAVYTLFLCGFVAWIYIAYKNEIFMYSGDKLTTRLLREQISSKTAWFCCSTIVSLLVYLVLKDRLSAEKYKNKASRALFSFIIIVMCAAYSFAPNIYLTSNNAGGIYHADAYINSIINVAHYVPYDDSATSIYGHYGIVYLPFVKLLGNSTHSVMCAISMFTAILYISIVHIMDYFTDNDTLFFITLSAIAGISTTFYGYGQYYQIYPHRILFPILTISLLIVDQKKTKPNGFRIMIATMFGIVACLFNLETGLCCTLVIGVYACLRETGYSLKNLCIKASFLFLYISICFFGALFTVDLYNLLVGGGLNTIRQFIFPVGSSVYDMFDTLHTPLPGEKGIFLIHLFVFFVTVLFCTVHLTYNNVTRKNCIEGYGGMAKKNEGRTLICLCLAISGMGSITYFMNRTAPTCLAISHIQFIMCLSITISIVKK